MDNKYYSDIVTDAVARSQKRNSTRGYGKASSIVGHYLGVSMYPYPSASKLVEAIFCHKKMGAPNLPKALKKVVVLCFCDQIKGESIGFVPQPARAKARPKVAPSTDFYWSDEWRSIRYAVLRKSRGACVLCGAGPSAGHPLHVDHIKPRSRFPELQLDPSNLQVLCEDCNLGKSNTDTIDWRAS